MRVPFKFDMEGMKQAMARQLTEPTTKKKVLFVDAEMYGPVEFTDDELRKRAKASLSRIRRRAGPRSDG